MGRPSRDNRRAPTPQPAGTMEEEARQDAARVKHTDYLSIALTCTNTFSMGDLDQVAGFVGQRGLGWSQKGYGGCWRQRLESRWDYANRLRAASMCAVPM